MDKREREIYDRAIKEKYKYHKFWKIATFVFGAVSIVFSILYFVS